MLSGKDRTDSGSPLDAENPAAYKGQLTNCLLIKCLMDF